MVYGGQWLHLEMMSMNMTNVNMWLRRRVHRIREGRAQNSTLRPFCSPAQMFSSFNLMYLKAIKVW